MTKVTILGEPQGAEPKKKIEFVKSITHSSVEKASMQPKDFENVIFISRSYSGDFDLMFATNSEAPYHDGVAYLGYFNQGIV